MFYLPKRHRPQILKETPVDSARLQKRGVAPSRRFFIKGAVGLLALPFLETFAQRNLQAQSVEHPLRILTLYNPNGTVPESWFPKLGENASSFELGSIHTPLASFKQQLVLFDGINNQVAVDRENPGGPHQRGIGALFTGERLGSGTFTDGCGKAAGWAQGLSVDQRLAQHFGDATRFKSLELGVRCTDNDVQGRISYRGADTPLSPENNPQVVFERLFGQAPSFDQSDPALRRQSVLDGVKEQFAILKPRLSTQDRLTMDAHLELVRSLELGLERPAGDNPECAAPLFQPLDPNSEVDMPAISRVQLKLMATAFGCDLTRVGSLIYSSGFNKIRYPWVDDGGEGHSMSHAGPSDTSTWNKLRQRATWHAEELAYFLRLLDEMPEGEGSVLDNTLVLWGSEVSQGNSHSLNRIPFLMAGGAGGRLKMGQALKFENGSVNDVLLSVLRAYGVADQHFGVPEYNQGPISGLVA